MNVQFARARYQFGLMPANLTTLAHFSVSSVINRPNSAGDPGRTAPPVSRRRAFIVELVKAALISLLNLSVGFRRMGPYGMRRLRARFA